MFSFLFHTLLLGILIVQTSPIPFVLSSTDCIQYNMRTKGVISYTELYELRHPRAEDTEGK